MATSKHLGSRLSTISSQQLKTATLKVNQGESPLPPADQDPPADVILPTESPGGDLSSDVYPLPPSSGRERFLPGTSTDNLPSTKSEAWVSIAGAIDKVSTRDWQNMETFTKNARQYKGQLTNDVAKLTAENHEFLKALKYTMGVDISQFVNNFIEQFRGRYKEELPGITKR